MIEKVAWKCGCQRRDVSKKSPVTMRVLRKATRDGELPDSTVAARLPSVGMGGTVCPLNARCVQFWPKARGPRVAASTLPARYVIEFTSQPTHLENSPSLRVKRRTSFRVFGLMSSARQRLVSRSRKRSTICSTRVESPDRRMNGETDAARFIPLANRDRIAWSTCSAVVRVSRWSGLVAESRRFALGSGDVDPHKFGFSLWPTGLQSTATDACPAISGPGWVVSSGPALCSATWP